MNYFELFEIPVNLQINLSSLRKKYFALCKKYHPDKFISESKAKQDDAEQEFATINLAYDCLIDLQRRIAYILKIYGTKNEPKYALDPMFLMEMMDINEQLDELENEQASNGIENLKNEIDLKIEDLYNEVQEDLDQDQILVSDLNILTNLRAFYYKMKYIMRIKEKIITFANQ